MNGFFKIDRQLFDHWLWQDKPFSKGQAWIDLIGLANYEDGKAAYKGQVIECKRGTVCRSISFLAERWGWSRDKTRRFLKLLETDSMITLNSTVNNTAITLMNYSKFQDKTTAHKTVNRQQTIQQADSEQGKEIRINKNNKENKNSVSRGMERETDYDALIIPRSVKRRGEK